jgi:hypothetical protein
MGEENILTWNLPNWITVVLMAAIGFAALAALGSFIKSRSNSGDDGAGA